MAFLHSEARKAKKIIYNLSKKHTYKTRPKIGFSIKLFVKVNIKPKLITIYTKQKFFSRSRSVSLKVFDLEKKNLINIFTTLTSAAKFFQVSHKTFKHQINVFMLVELFLNMNIRILKYVYIILIIICLCYLIMLKSSLIVHYII